MPEFAFGCQTANTAACGSTRMAMRPWSPTSNGPACSLPPRDCAFAAAASVSVTETYDIQNGGTPAMSGPNLYMAAQSAPFFWKM